MLKNDLRRYLSSLLSIRNLGRILDAYGISDSALDQLLEKTRPRQGEDSPRSGKENRLDTEYSNFGGDTISDLLKIIPPDVAETWAKHDQFSQRLAAIYSKEGSRKYLKKADRIFACQQSHMVFLGMDRTEPLETTVLPYACNSRCCPVCSRMKSEKTFNRAHDTLRNLFDRRQIIVRWITFTIKNPPVGDLAQSILDLLKAFRRLRRPREMNGKRGDHWNCWTERVDGYIWNMEITYNSEFRSWHPHIHVLFGGDFLPWQELKVEWTKALRPTGRSGDVKIDEAYFFDIHGHKQSTRNAESTDDALAFLKEVTKYNLKAFESDIPASCILELTEAVFNKRLFGSGGDWLLPPAQDRNKESQWMLEGGLKKIISEDPLFWSDSEFQGKLLKSCSSSIGQWLRIVRNYDLYYLIQREDSSKEPDDE